MVALFEVLALWGLAVLALFIGGVLIQSKLGRMKMRDKKSIKATGNGLNNHD